MFADAATTQAEKTFEELIHPSVSTIQSTYHALQDTCEEITAASQGVLQTISMSADLLNMMSGSGYTSSLMNPITLPLPMAMKAISVTASKYVEQKTGLSLRSWTDFANSTRVQFDDYLAQLRQIGKRFEEIDEDKQAYLSAAKNLRVERKLIEITRKKSRLWRPVLAQVIKINQLIDSLLEASQENVQSQVADGAIDTSQSNWKKKLSNIGEKVGESVTKFTSQHEELMAKVLAPLYDLQEKARSLRSQVDKMSEYVNWLEDLLELEIHQIDAALGVISSDHKDMLDRRIAVSISIPQLHRQFLENERAIQNYQVYLSKLPGEERIGTAPKHIIHELEEEYRARLIKLAEKKEILRDEICIWMDEGLPFLHEGLVWIQNRLHCLAVREKVGELTSQRAGEERAVIRREIKRFEDAMALIAKLAE